MPPAPPGFQGCCVPLGTALSRDRAELPVALGATPGPLPPDRRRPSRPGAKRRDKKTRRTFFKKPNNLSQTISPKPSNQLWGSANPRRGKNKEGKCSRSSRNRWFEADQISRWHPLPSRRGRCSDAPAGPAPGSPSPRLRHPRRPQVRAPGPAARWAARTSSRPIPPLLTQTPGETVHLVWGEAGAGAQGEAAVVVGRDRFIHPRSGGRQRRRRSPALASRPGQRLQRLRQLPAAPGGSPRSAAPPPPPAAASRAAAGPALPGSVPAPRPQHRSKCRAAPAPATSAAPAPRAVVLPTPPALAAAASPAGGPAPRFRRRAGSAQRLGPGLHERSDRCPSAAGAGCADGTGLNRTGCWARPGSGSAGASAPSQAWDRPGAVPRFAFKSLCCRAHC